MKPELQLPPMNKYNMIVRIIVALCWGEALGGVISRPIAALGNLRKKTIINNYYYNTKEKEDGESS